MLTLWLLACAAEEYCEPFDLGEDECEPAEICCIERGGDIDCDYVTLDNTRFPCVSIDCTQAREALRCEVCDVGPEPAPGCD